MRTNLFYGTALCLLVMNPAIALAQTAAPADDGLQDIIVTAQKRSESIQDVGIAITALNAQSLEAIGRRDVTALVTQVPNLQVNQYNPTSTIFNIRGVSQNDISDAQEAPIAFYNDEVYISSSGAISGQSFDLERVEVLRGPQGTLFGRNATGGLVQLITAKPTKELEGFVSLTVGRFNQVSSEAAVSGPLSDHIRGRLSFSSNRNDGYVRNVQGGPKGQNARFYAGRAQLEFDVGETAKLLAKVEYMRNDHETSTYTHRAASFDSDGLGVPLPATLDFWTGQLSPAGFPYSSCDGCDANGYKSSTNPYVSNVDKRGVFDRKYWNATIRFEAELPFATLTSITNYQDLNKLYGIDADASPNDVFNTDATQKLYQVSEEMRLSGQSDTVKWVAGLYGLKIHSDNTLRLGQLVTSPPAFSLYSTQDYTLLTESLAAFAQVEYKLNDQFSAIIGGRYSVDWKKYDWTNFLHAPSGDPVNAPGGFDSVEQFNRTLYPGLASLKFEDYSGKLELDYKPNDDTLIYASVNRGTKSGGFNTQFPQLNAAQMPFGKEALTNYEGGFKLTLANRKLTVNGSLFHYDYKGYQAFSTPSPGQTTVSNQPAKISGWELEVKARPVRGLNLGLWAANLFQAKVENVALPSQRVTDRRMPQAPKWSLGANASYDVEIGDGTLTFWTNWKYDSEQYFSAYNSPLGLEKARVTGDVRVSYGQDEWQAAVFVNNVTDKRYRLFANDSGKDLGAEQSIYAAPRWWGVSLTYRYGS